MLTQAEARKAYEEAKGYADQATSAMEGTPAQIRQMEAAFANQEKNIAREEQLLSSIDPALIEASTQVLKLLRGEEASVLDPVRKDRQRKRQQLLDSLREQFGPGAESSSAGVQALTAFDAESSNLMASAQQNSISQLFGATSSILPSLSNSRGLAASRLQQGIGQRQGQLAGTFLDAGRLTGAARTGMIQNAGASQVQSALRAGQIQGIGNDIFRGGLAYMTGGMSEGAALFGTGKEALGAAKSDAFVEGLMSK